MNVVNVMKIEICDVSFLESSFPAPLRDLADPPHLISMIGQTDFDSRPVLAVIGSRYSSLQAETWMQRHLGELARSSLIVSGGARGIDEMAHAIAIKEEQPTVVVLPSGLNRPYPKSWSEKLRDITIHGGSLISEYSPDTEVRAWHFEKRNRLIAALADVVLVVEARQRSGTSITVRHALELGRAVAALPWFPSDSRGEYCNEILASGGVLIRHASDLADLLVTEARQRAIRIQGSLTVPNSTKKKETGNRK